MNAGSGRARDWPSAAKIVAGAIMGQPVRIKGSPAGAELVTREGGDEFVRRIAG